MRNPGPARRFAPCIPTMSSCCRTDLLPRRNDAASWWLSLLEFNLAFGAVLAFGGSREIVREEIRMASTVVITGASAGVGRAVAIEFARQGCNVALIARGQERLASAARAAREFGVEVLAIAVDVADAAELDHAAERVERELGPIDVWVNDAMATIFAPVHEIKPEEFRRVTEVTYLGQVHGTLAALKRMRRRDRGTIVQVGSALSYRAIPLQSAYCAAKFAVRGFTDSLRSELAHEGSGIRLTMVQLPAVNTPQFDWARSRMPKKAQPVPPIFQPEAIAREIVRAARKPRASFGLVARR